MHIREIRIERYRHLADVVIAPPKAGEFSSAIALAGPNGGGKTSILEVIALSMANSFALPLTLDRYTDDYAFEVDLGITEHEASLIRDVAEKSPTAFVREEVERFAADRRYTRYFNRWPTDDPDYHWHGRAHDLVLSTLSGAYGRPVGFSLGADRRYPNVAFQQQTLLQPPEDPAARNRNFAYQLPEFQYRDMLDFLIEGQYRHLMSVGRHMESGGDFDARPQSPVRQYNQLFERIMPGYSITTNPDEATPTNLYVQIPSGDVIPFAELSSGEREVFFVLASFLRQDVSNAVVTVDEPELHLHPELTRRLVRTMLDIKPGNQIWLATHNGEVFDEVGRDRTFYVARGRKAGANVCRASESSESETLLREMFGYSGYVGISRSLLFLEGEHASLDRRVFGRLFPNELSDVKLVPAGGVDTVTRVNSAVLQIIEEGVGWMSCYALRDRDFLADEEVANYNSHPSGRLRVLERCHIENYLLHDAILAEVMTTIFDREMTEDDVRGSLREAAEAVSADVLGKMVSFKLQRRTWPEDFSISEYRGVNILDGSNVNDGLVRAIEEKFQAGGEKVRFSMDSRLSRTAISALVEETLETVVAALRSDHGARSWRHIFPGKRLMAEFAKKNGVDPTALQNSVLSQMALKPASIPGELKRIMALVSAGSRIS